MKNNSLYENLDTAFVDLDSLVRYLRRRKFIGGLRVSFTGYSGEIAFTAEGKLRVTERDKIAGLQADGERAFLSIIARSKESGGIVNVIKPAETATLSEVKRFPTERTTAARSRSHSVSAANGELLEHINIAQIDEVSNVTRPDFPFPLTNEVEEKARQIRKPANDRDTLVILTSELLKTVDQALEKAHLNFSAAFAKACSEICGEYPFMDPARGDFTYRAGQIRANADSVPLNFVDGVGEALRRIFGRLNSAPRLGKVYRFATQRVRALNHERRDDYDRYMISPIIDEMLRA